MISSSRPRDSNKPHTQVPKKTPSKRTNAKTLKTLNNQDEGHGKREKKERKKERERERERERETGRDRERQGETGRQPTPPKRLRMPTARTANFHPVDNESAAFPGDVARAGGKSG